MSQRKILVALAIHYGGEWDKIYKALMEKRYLPDDVADAYISSLKCNFITILDSDYPEYLKEQRCPPFVLFYYGDISLINDPIVSQLNKDIIVVSGLAKGIDAIAHLTSFKTNRRTVAVLGCGIENVYPVDNEELYSKFRKSKFNLIISEYPGMTNPEMFHFPARNRLIAAFSSSVLVTEAKIQSGTMITASFAVHYDRRVLCLPSNDYGNSGCNALIREGAILVENAEQVNEFYE